MTHHILWRWCAIAVCILASVPAMAQPAMADAEAARLHVGPLALDPRLAIRHVGVDTNVFNTASTPVRDFTATVGPDLDSWLRVGRLAWAGTSSVSWNYFRDSAAERSFNLGQDGRLELDLGRIVPFGTGTFDRSRQRPNLEIDARVRRETTSAGAGVDVLIGGRATVSFEYGMREFAFGDANVPGATLALALDRRETSTRLRARHRLTPLTTLVIEAEQRNDRFRFSTDRNSDSLRLTSGVDLRPLALVSGRARVGVRQLTPHSPDIPDFTGAIADVELSYQIRDMTRFSVLVQRDVDYSFQTEQAYYVSTGSRLSVVQALGGGWDVRAHAARTVLAYQTRREEQISEADRRDRVTVYGLGVGRRFGTDVRLGVEMEYAARASNISNRRYEGLRGGGTFTYGF